jgi:ribosomal-protein-alanine N-acetyltransferase
VTPHAPLRTDRLILRRWRDSDRAPFAELNADPAVMEHFPARLSRAESDAMIDRVDARFDEYGYGLWALEIAATGEFIGFTGLQMPGFDAPFMPLVEIGWRLARSAWGHGYASEAARRALAIGFDDFRLGQIVSFTATTNIRSQAVMVRLGMTHDPADDFDHPRQPVGSPLRRHVLYRLTRQQYSVDSPQ